MYKFVKYDRNLKKFIRFSIAKYYSGSKEVIINKLEQLYINKIDEMTLEENRLNTFSENAEFRLWTNVC